MVKIETIPDNADEWESSSEASAASSDAFDGDDFDDDDLFDPNGETLADRFAALSDMVPPSTRAAAADATARTTAWLKWGASWMGSTIWVVTTSALLVGMPLMLSIEGEAALVEQEKQFNAQQQPGIQQASGYGGLPGAVPAAGSTGVVPPGF